MAALMEQLQIMSDLQTEADIIEACKEGDREAFHILFEEHKDRIYTIAFHYSGDESMARDVTQQVFLKLFTTIGQFRENSQFSTWLYRIVANACADEHRKRRRFVPFSPEIEVSKMTVKSSQEEAYHRRQVADSVSAAIAELTPKLRLPILLKYVEGLSYDEIAEALGISIGTVSSRLNRGHKMLARKLGHLRSEVAAGE
ncbi:MAG TPA: sigma-70 family RNA polymerase sigma factor [Blastocatellia bacterium]|nr:sigma-70 family RNA polymerase sigma factor [Blastocatellia bacterium]